MPTVALTFDEYRTTFDVAFPIMSRYGLVGTYYVDPRQIDIEGGIASAELREMQGAGWEIGLYSVRNVNKIATEEGEASARQWLALIKSMMLEKGFEATSLAAAQRSWGPVERSAAEGQFSTVRVVDHFSAQNYPIEDALFVKAGGTQSLSAADHLSQLEKQLEELLVGRGLWTIVAHMIGPGDPIYAMPADTFEEMISLIAERADAGDLRVATFSEAIVPR